MSSLNVLTWNFGTDEKYKEMLLRAGDTPPEGLEGLRALRDQTAKVAFEILISENNPDIMFLQEIGSDLDRIKRLLGDDFEIISDGENTAVAFRTRFEAIDSSLSDNRRFTILTLKDRLTEKIYNVASAHIPIFDLKHPLIGSPTAPEGDKALEELLSKLNELDANGTIIGLDANTTRELYPQRLELLEKAGFQTNDKDSAPTNYNSTLQGRVKSDFIFVRGFTFQPFEPLHLKLEKPRNNPSDHIPVIEQLKFDLTSIEKSKAAPAAAADLDESFEKAKNVGIGEDDKDSEVRKRLQRLGFAMTPSPLPAGKGGTIRGTPFSLFSDSPAASPNPDAAPAAEEVEPLPAFDSLDVQALKGAPKEAAANLPPPARALPPVPAKAAKAAAKTEAEATAKALAENEAKAKEEAEAKAKEAAAAKLKAARRAAAQAGLATISTAPTRLPPPAPAKSAAPIDAEAAAAKAKRRAKAQAAAAKAIAFRPKALPRPNTVGAKKNNSNCMHKTAIVALVAFASITIPIVGSFYSFE